MIKIILNLTLTILTLFFTTLSALTKEDIQFIRTHELFDYVQDNQKKIHDYIKQNKNDDIAWNMLEDNYRVRRDTLSLFRWYIERSKIQKSLSHAKMALDISAIHPEYLSKACYDSLLKAYATPYSKDFITYSKSPNENLKKRMIRKYIPYPKQIEQWAKDSFDEFSIEANPEKRLVLIESFLKDYPSSKYFPTALYYYYFTLKSLKKYDTFSKDYLKRIKKNISPEIAYVVSSQINDPLFRKHYFGGQPNKMLLTHSLNRLKAALIKVDKDKKTLYYINGAPWNKKMFKNKIYMEMAKTNYYLILHQKKEYGDEEKTAILFNKTSKNFIDGIDNLKKIKYENNDQGEIANLHFWYGKFYKDIKTRQMQMEALDHFLECLTLGAPRNPYEKQVMTYITQLRGYLNIHEDMLTWSRKRLNYKGPIFSDITKSAGLDSIKAGRVSWGDYDNDGYDDLLLSGNLIFHNNRNMTFSNVTDSLGYVYQANTGGIWFDLNKDGKLDFVTLSSSHEGEKLMLNKGNKFVSINDKAGDINDGMPSEGIAVVDSDHDGYADIYTANYETWGEKSGYPDKYWENEEGYFTDKTKKLGFVNELYPELAGRGVSPADFDNDGEQEIFVSNYRLNKNYLWDKQKGIYQDISSLARVQGECQEGYYGHSIGADWGDFDNDGDLDLFIANLAHPRFIEFSDISMLLRNDGMKDYTLDGENISYPVFTNITKQSGIKYDETHSDPLWFDADNDGDLDLFITSIYPNERTYLYLNKGDGTFKDVTWLAGLRTFNAWGNAYADINHDGKLDLLVASGDGVKLYLNQTDNHNQSKTFRVVWNQQQISVLNQDQWNNYNNSPAYGARLLIKSRADKKSKIRIHELCSAKGTTSQNAQIVHIGYGKEKIEKIQVMFNNQVIFETKPE